MSETELFRLGVDPGLIGITSRGTRSGLYVWQDFAKRYHQCDFSLFNSITQKLIWDSYKLPHVPLHEKIVLLSTMDRAYVKAEQLPILLASFDLYAQHHPNSSMGDQAELIRSVAFPLGSALGWNQTSVSQSQWMKTDEDDNEIWLGPDTPDFDCFDLITDALSHPFSVSLGELEELVHNYQEQHAAKE